MPHRQELRLHNALEPADEPSADTGPRILAAASALIRESGPEAATTRAISARAGVQAPTIYRLFGDKQGLLNAVAEDVLAAFVQGKSKRVATGDAVAELRRGWDDYVEFGLAHPALFSIISQNARSPAAIAGIAVLRQRVRAIAGQGRLRVPEERAIAMIHAAGVGVVLTLIASDSAGDIDVSAATRDAILAAITREALADSGTTPQLSAVTLKAQLGDTQVLSNGERMLLDELLTRIARSSE